MWTLSGYLCACVPGVDGSSGEPHSISGSDLVCACLGSQRLPSPRLRNGFDTVGMCSSVIKNRNGCRGYTARALQFDRVLQGRMRTFWTTQQIR